MRSIPVFLLLLLIKLVSRILFRFDVEWVGEARRHPWQDVRLIAVLNHTSLYEPVFAALVPVRTLWRLARNGVVPVADKTIRRPGVGVLFRLVCGRVVPVTRKRDATWEEVLRHFRDPRAVTVIFPEGRMLRRTGLDADGNPMTVRGGVAELIAGVPGGRMLLAYSGGLHHVAAPGDRIPRPFRRIAVRLETLDIAAYRAALGYAEQPESFSRRVVEDLTMRRNRCCPVRHGTRPHWSAA